MGITFTIKKKIIINWHPAGTTHLGSYSGFGLSGLYDIFFKPDGTRMYLADANANNVYQFDLSTPWDITTETSAGSFSGDNLIGVCLSSDGTKLFVSKGHPSNVVERYDLSTAWDVTTAGSLHSSVTTYGDSVRISEDGLTLLSNTSAIKQYALSTAFDLSTASLTGQFHGQNGGFTSDGRNLARTNEDYPLIYIYDLDTPWNVLSGRTYNGSVDISAHHTTPKGIAVSTDGSRAYVCERGTGRVDYYSLGSEAP